MNKRIAIGLGLLILFLIGGYAAWEASRLYLIKAGVGGSYSYNLFFKSSGWLVLLAVFLGVFAGGAARRERTKPVIQGEKVLRHDVAAFLMHWSHALATVVLLGTGLNLGFLGFPRRAVTPEAAGFALNLHFVGVFILLFGLAYYLTETYLGGSFKEHMPEAGDLKAGLSHYTAKFGVGRAPKEGKYLASEKLSYPGWILVVGALVLTGGVKMAAHLWDLPGGLMGPVTFLHDAAALGMLAMLGIHIIMAAVLPWSWPLLQSMLTGYVPVAYVRKHHVQWYEELTGESAGGEAPAGSPNIPASS